MIIRLWALTIVLLMPIPANSEINNGPRIFETVRACGPFMWFLRSRYDSELADRSESFSSSRISDLTDRPELQDCHAIENFLLRNSHETDDVFLFRLERNSGRDSALSALVNMNIAVRKGDPWEVLASALDVAMVASIKLAMSQDEERAAVYGRIAQQLQLKAMDQICGLGEMCHRLPEVSGLMLILGDDFADLDTLPSERTAMCLIRVDGFTVPIRDVVKSRAFETCVENAN
ncbi:MAG: hypothetical protein AAFN63_18345 [Pseudomonadota bacterium]